MLNWAYRRTYACYTSHFASAAQCYANASSNGAVKQLHMRTPVNYTRDAGNNKAAGRITKHR